GGALETLSDVNVAVFDKTGTLTVGKPRLDRVRVSPGFDEDTVLRYTAAVEEHSSHLLALVLCDAGGAKGKTIPRSTSHLEAAGQGIEGRVDGHVLRVGARSFVVPSSDDGWEMADRFEQSPATLRAYVSIDGRLAAVLEYADQIRSDL